MFSKSAKYYDLIYGAFKDYRAEAVKIAALVRSAHPQVKTVLDVGCGSGEHARFLTEDHGLIVDGLDLEAQLVDVASAKLPGSKFVVGDMIDFDMGKQYDVVTCLFSSIGYVRTLDNVTRALSRFREHLLPKGIVIVEPWFTPDKWEGGNLFMNCADKPGLKVSRIASTNREGKLSKLRFEYLIGTQADIIHEREDHELGLFSVDEMQQCFTRAGLSADYDPEGITGRGLYVAKASGVTNGSTGEFA